MIAVLLICSASFAAEPPARSTVYIIKTTDRVAGIQALLEEIDLSGLHDKKIVVKPNYNSDDPFPATTHIDTLKTVIWALKKVTPESITIVERSGMGDTGEVLENRGVYALAASEEVRLVNLDDLRSKFWVNRGTPESHWKYGFMVPEFVLEADYVVNLPCLKTHRFGGDFTMSLKNNVGLVAKRFGGYSYMWELHHSPHQRLMIAEINKYLPDQIIVMDGIKGFSKGGPESGALIKPGIMLLSTDPVAIDAVGVAVLRLYDTTEAVKKGKIFDQDQIRRAAEWGIGVGSPEEIELVAVNADAEAMVKKIEKMLSK